MKVGIIGYGSMGRMLLEKIESAGKAEAKDLYISTRTKEKIRHLKGKFNVCEDNKELAAACDIVFLAVRAGDIKPIMEEILPVMKKETRLVSLNASISFTALEKLFDGKIAKLTPSVTAEIGRSKTLICYNGKMEVGDKSEIENLLTALGSVEALPEDEIWLATDLTSCMPGFVAAIFDVFSQSAMSHTSLPKERVQEMVLDTVAATSAMMMEKGMSFPEVVKRVATPGGITEEGTNRIYEKLPAIADEIYAKTLEKESATSKKLDELF